MKRVIFVLCVMVIFLSSCTGDKCDDNKKDNKCDVIVNFTAQANIITDKDNILCSLSRAANNVSCINIYEPQQLKGLKFVCSDDKYSVEYDNLLYETDDLYLPDTAFSKAIMNVLDSIESKESLEQIDMYDKISVLKGKCNLGDFEVFVNTETKFIEKMVIDSINLNVIFSEQR